MNTLIPTRREISPTDGIDLDERYAIVHFFGKNISEAKKLFEENVDFYCSDLIWMGPKAFQFYMGAFLNYIIAKNDMDMSPEIDNLTMILEIKITEGNSKLLFPLKKKILKALDHCAENSFLQ